jgi:predicted DNA-binding transcriptional regulator AlpA
MTTTTEMDSLLRARDLARILATHERTIWRWVAVGILPQPLGIGQVNARDGSRSPKRHCAARWRRSDIESFLAQRADAAAKETERMAKP